MRGPTSIEICDPEVHVTKFGNLCNQGGNVQTTRKAKLEHVLEAKAQMAFNVRSDQIW